MTTTSIPKGLKPIKALPAEDQFTIIQSLDYLRDEFLDYVKSIEKDRIRDTIIDPIRNSLKGHLKNNIINFGFYKPVELAIIYPDNLTRDFNLALYGHESKQSILKILSQETILAFEGVEDNCPTSETDQELKRLNWSLADDIRALFREVETKVLNDLIAQEYTPAIDKYLDGFEPLKNYFIADNGGILELYSEYNYKEVESITKFISQFPLEPIRNLVSDLLDEKVKARSHKALAIVLEDDGYDTESIIQKCIEYRIEYGLPEINKEGNLIQVTNH